MYGSRGTPCVPSWIFPIPTMKHPLFLPCKTCSLEHPLFPFMEHLLLSLNSLFPLGPLLSSYHRTPIFSLLGTRSARFWEHPPLHSIEHTILSMEQLSLSWTSICFLIGHVAIPLFSINHILFPLLNIIFPIYGILYMPVGPRFGNHQNSGTRISV